MRLRNFWVAGNTLLFFNTLLLTLTGLILKFRLPPGTGYSIGIGSARRFPLVGKMMTEEVFPLVARDAIVRRICQR